MKTITDAVIPVAGLGTRLLPATRSQPKEMLQLVAKPVVQYVVEELVRAGIGRVLFVTGRRKRAIEDHFDADPELALRQTEPDSSGQVQLTDALRRIIQRGERVMAVRLAGGERRHDVGTVESYCAVFLEYALNDSRVGAALRAQAAALLDRGV